MIQRTTSRNEKTWSHLSVECERVIWWYRCRKVKAVMALDLKLSFSATIFSMRPRSDTVNLHCPMRMSSSVGVTSHSSSVTLAAMWRQLRLTQDRCFGWIWFAQHGKDTNLENGWSSPTRIYQVGPSYSNHWLKPTSGCCSAESTTRTTTQLF